MDLFIQVRLELYYLLCLEAMKTTKSFHMPQRYAQPVLDACPVKIPLHELLHKHRQRIVEKKKEKHLFRKSSR